MRPYVLSVLPSEDVELFERIRQVINSFPDVSLGTDEKGEELILTCHILARAAGKVFGLKYVDGLFYPNYEHSWLVTKAGSIIDVYPVGMYGGPIMLEGNIKDRYNFSPARWLYKKRRILGGRTKKPSFRRAVRKVTKILRNIMEQ